MQAPPEPGSGEKIDYAALKDRLLHITVREVVKDVQTTFGPTDAVRATLAVLDGPDKGKIIEDSLIFPRVLQGQLKDFVGKPDPAVIGRLGQGTAKAGQSAPWILNPPSADDMVVATKYEAYAAQQAAKQDEPY